MIDFDKIVGTEFRKNPPSNASDLAKLEASIGASLPDDYKRFLLFSNGGEGNIGDLYISIWPIEEVLNLNTLYSIPRRLGEKILGIGTDGGDYCFALDLQENDNQFAVVSLGALAKEEIKNLAKNFLGGLIGMRDKTITDNDL